MCSKFFGTDGIRGRANKAPMDAATALKVGMAAGIYFTRGEYRHRVVIGKDTRLSGYLIEPALTSGFIAMGIDVILVGPMPTPAVSIITRSLRADLGVMISASHNQYHDNGIKLFGPDGLKLSDDVEAKLEELMESDMEAFQAKPSHLGRAKRLDDAAGRYVEYVKHTLPKNIRFDGLRVVVDCANGAAYKLAPSILWELGAEVIPLAVAPDGFNINENCGSTYPATLSSAVKEYKADLGIALDGDADRLIICDENGELIDGDQIMGAIATYWKEGGKLKGGGIVATVMSNLALEEYLESAGLKLERTKVGDRYVLEKMLSGKYNLGGEQSGHIIFNDYVTTGDGIVAALQVMGLLIEKGLPASKSLRVFEPFPQLMENIAYDENNEDPLNNQIVKGAIKRVEGNLSGKGRVLVRKSGTEPLIRVMVEANEESLAESAVAEIVASIKAVQNDQSEEFQGVRVAG